MNFLHLDGIKPIWALRLTLGIMYIYTGVDFLRAPEHWYGFAPSWFSQFVLTILPSMDVYLRIQGVGELVLGFVFLAWFLPMVAVRIVAFLSMLEMALILLLAGIDLVTFRDIPILGASLAVFLMTFQNYGSAKQV